MAWCASARSVARTILPTPGKERRIAASRCSARCPGLGLRPGELADQDVDVAGDVLDLAVDKVQPLSDVVDMSARRVGRAWRHGQRRALQDR